MSQIDDRSEPSSHAEEVRRVLLEINGSTYSLKVCPSELLIDVLRDHLRLTGTKRGCDEGVCGTCTVLVDGHPQQSCRLEVGKLEGKSITTIEGLSDDDLYHALKDAFLREGAVGCGFCTPAMLLRSVALLREIDKPSETEIRRAIQPVLCRCTGYLPIIRAIQHVAGLPVTKRIDEKGIDKPYKYIGRSAVKVDGELKAKGQAIFADDMHFPGMVHAALVRSKHPHARLISVDATKALSRPGVLAVLTSEDIKGVNAFGKSKIDQPILADTTVDYYGQPVALIVADTDAMAREAIRDVNVEYQELPSVLSIEEAQRTANDEYLIHHVDIREGGDLKHAFSDCAVIVEGTFQTQRTDPLFLEPPSAIAEVNDGTITIHSACQYPYGMQRQIAECLAYPLNSVRILQTQCGGGFGGKVEASVHIYVALAAEKLQRPVKMVLDREETFLSTTKRHPMLMHYRVGADSNGRVQAMDIEIHADAGAFETSSIAVLSVACRGATGPYEVPNYSVQGYAYRTHQVPSGAQRGFGIPQVALAHEAMMDDLALKLGLTPTEIRRRNTLHKGSRLPGGEIIECEIPTFDILDRLETTDQEKGTSTSIKTKGRGIAFCYKSVGYSGGDDNIARTCVELGDDGTIQLKLGCIEMGQGAFTAFSQILAEELGIDMSNIRVTIGDTDDHLDSCSTEGSRATLMVGQAVVDGARHFREVVITEAAKIFDVDPHKLTWKDGNVIGESEELKFSLAMIARERRDTEPLSAQGYSKAPIPGDLLEDGKTRVSAVDITYTGAYVEVEINKKTCEVEVCSIKLIQDVGFAINPINVQVQVEGGVVMGLGFALMEDFRFLSGIPETLRLAKYKVPRSKDIPPIEVELIETPGTVGPYGAKGIGELPMIPVAAAIANAINNAIGLRISELPITKERISGAIN